MSAKQRPAPRDATDPSGDGRGPTSRPTPSRAKSSRAPFESVEGSKPRPTRVTIRDVAARAGVSPATVSNALNRRPGVGQDTRRRVLDAVEATGFVRNSAAHRLRGGRSDAIAVIVLDVSNPFFAEVLHGIEAVVRDAGYVLIVCSTSESVAMERHYIRVLDQHGVDGLLITPTETDLESIATLANAGIPTVVVDRAAASSKLCSVSVDDLAGGQLAATHLLERGHRSIAFFNSVTLIPQYSDRYLGALRAIRANGQDEAEALIEFRLAMSVDSATAAIDRLLSSSPRPTAIICANDVLAFGALQGLNRAGVAVPEEISVVGYDDVVFASMMKLTTIRQPKYELGASAARLLLDELQNPAHEHQGLRFEPELVTRATTSECLRNPLSGRGRRCSGV